MERRKLGKTNLFVTPVCWGCAPLGNMPKTFGHEVSAQHASNLMFTALEGMKKGSVNFFDTASIYGKSESRIGKSLKMNGGLPDGCIIATKADRDISTNRFTALGMRESVMKSLQRLGIKKLPIVYLHDPEHDSRYESDKKIVIQELLAENGPVAELEKMKKEGIIENLGISGGPIDLLIEFIETGRFDVVITHNRWNLIYQTAEPLFVSAQKRNMGIVNAAPFGSGLFVSGNRSTRFVYKIPSKDIIERTMKIKKICQKYKVPIAAAALQFSLRDPRIHSTVVGVADSTQIEKDLAFLKIPIPEQLWIDIREYAITEGDPEK